VSELSITAVLSAVIAALVWVAADDPLIRTIAMAVAIVVLGLVLAFRHGRTFDMFSPAFFVGVTFVVSYGIAAVLPFFTDIAQTHTGSAYTGLEFYPQAAAAALMALVSFVLGYEALWRLCRARGAGFLRFRLGEATQWRTTLAMTAIGYTALVLAVMRNLFFQGTVQERDPLAIGVIGFGIQFMYLALAIATAHALEARSRHWQLLAVASFTAVVAIGFSSGSKSAALIGFVFLVLTWNYVRHGINRMRSVLLALGLSGVLLVLFPANLMYRTAVSEALLQDLSPRAATIYSLESTATAIGDLGTASFLELGYGYLGSRIANVDVVATVLKRQREGMEYGWGETYARVLPAFVPRLLWPNKPAISLSNEFAVTLGYSTPDVIMLGEEASFTAIGITLVGELVYNFPFVLIPLAAALLGLLFRWVYETFLEGFRASPALAVAVYALWWYGFVLPSFESNFATYFSGTVKATIGALLLFWFVDLVRARRAAPAIRGGTAIGGAGPDSGARG